MRVKLLFLVSIFVIMNCGNKIDELIDQGYLLGLGQSNDFERPFVITTSPFKGTRNVKTDSTVKIVFSREMDQLITETALTINSNGGNSNFSIEWNDPFTMEIKFSQGLTTGKRYELRLNKNLTRDISKNLMATEYIMDFYTIGFTSIPILVSSDPQNNNNITYSWPLDKNPILNFSDSMDEVTSNQGITISGGPAVFIREWSNESKQLTLRLISQLDQNVNYSINIQNSVKNTQGVNIDKDYRLNFFTGEESLRPTVLVTALPNSPNWNTLLPKPGINLRNNISKFDNFQFSFNVPMNRESTESAISFNPNISGRFQWPTNSLLEFIPNDPLEQNSRHTLNINDTAKDLNNINLNEAYSIEFNVNNPLDSLPVSVSNIRGYSVDASCSTTLDSNPNAPSFPINNNNLYSINITSTACNLMDYMIEITFNTSNGCALKTSGSGDIFNQVSFSYFSGGPGGGSPSVFYKDYNPPVICSAPGPYRIGIKTVLPNVQYSMRLNGGKSGVNDINFNYLINDVFFVFQRL